jgi:hypothetical protein
MAIRAALVAFLLLGTIAHRCEARSRNRLPPSAAQALSAFNTVILYSLEPEEEADASDPRLHYFKILGETELNRKRTATAIEAFKRAISNWDGIIAYCFNPRQAIRVAARGHTYDFLLCYECHQLYVYEDDKLLRVLGAAGSPEVLDNLLTAVALPLAKTESEEEIAARWKKDQEEKARWLAQIPSPVLDRRDEAGIPARQSQTSSRTPSAGISRCHPANSRAIQVVRLRRWAMVCLFCLRRNTGTITPGFSDG